MLLGLCCVLLQADFPNVECMLAFRYSTSPDQILRGDVTIREGGGKRQNETCKENILK